MNREAIFIEKKTILFVIDSLDTAGAEKSLVTLLSMLDYEKYQVDLQLFGYGYPLEQLVPQEVNILKPLNYTNFTKLHLKHAILHAARNKAYKKLAARLRYSAQIRRKNLTNSQQAMIYWKNASSVIEHNPKKYDIAIGYAQGIPTFYVAEKVDATVKFAWVNESYRLNDQEAMFQTTYYEAFKKIVAVSDSAKEILKETFPSYQDKLKVLYDINDPHFISQMAMMDNGFTDSFKGIRILTIGRLTSLKGYDIALRACKYLKDAGINFRWYVLGKGPLQVEIEEYIKEHRLENHFILLGVKTNPYPLIREADLYVQTSRTEGFGLAIAEARILNTPVVTTRFDSVYNQMVDEKNGLVVDMNPQAVYEGIVRLINDHHLREEIVKYLHDEKKGNAEDIDRFYELIH